MIKKILGIFISLSILVCAVFSPQYTTTIVAFPFIYLILKQFSHKKFIKNYLLLICLLAFLSVFTLNYVVINYTNIVVRHDVQEFVITSQETCLQQAKDTSIIILCNEKPFFNFENSTYAPLQKGKSFKIVSVDSDSENFHHSVIVKMNDNNQKTFFARINHNEIGEFKINGKSHSIKNDLLINVSYIATIPIALAFLATFGFLFFF